MPDNSLILLSTARIRSSSLPKRLRPRLKH